MDHKVNMKQFGLVLFMIFYVGVKGMAQSVAWGAAVNIGTHPGETDVSTTGNLLYAYAWGNVSTTINGVPFTGTAATSGNIPSGNPDITLTTSWVYYHNNSGPTSGLTAPYRTMLAGDIDQYAINSGPQTITLNQLTIGHTYLIQAWISSASDGWNNTAKQLTVTNANGTTTTCYGYGNSANGLGQYTTGTFTAGATTQAFVIIGVNYGFPQINAIQVRDTTISGPPPAPTGLSATAGNAQVSLSWTVSSGTTSYNVKRATVSGGPYTTIASGVTTTNYNDTGLNNGTTYCYVFSAVNSFGEGANSSEVSATPMAGLPPSTPTGLTAMAGNAQLSLSWNASFGAISYNVKRATVSGGPYTTIASSVTTTSYTDTGLNNGTTYYYVISSVNAAGESVNSSQAGTTPSAAGSVVPPGAAVLGYTLSVINENPTASDIAPGANGPYKWFDGQWWESPPPMSDYWTTNGVLAMGLGGDLASMPRDFSTGALPLLSGAGGFYVEFEVQLSDTNSDHWPAVWLMPWEHPSADQYPEDPSGYERFMEFDVDEGGFGPGLTGTVHSWAGYYPEYLNSAQNPNNVSPDALDRSQKHIFGGSYDPVRQTTAWWLDGVRQMIAGPPAVPAIATNQHFYLIISDQSHGLNVPYTMLISSVKAYVLPQTVVGSPTNLPAITIQPQDINAGLGWDVAFSVGTANETAFQWRKDGTNIVGATSYVCPILHIQTADAGNYSVVVTNMAGSVTSADAMLTVNGPPPPALTIQPAVVISWSDIISSEYGLRGSPSVSLPQWTTVSNGSAVTGGKIKVPVPITSSNQFFRLFKEP
jgi:hypothetical protein